MRRCRPQTAFILRKGSFFYNPSDQLFKFKFLPRAAIKTIWGTLRPHTHEREVIARTMKLFDREPDKTPETETRQLNETMAAVQDRCDVLLRSIAEILQFLKTFALDIQDIQSDRFKEEIQQIDERLREPDHPKRFELYFEQKKEGIVSFIHRQHAYIMDREKELRDIIDLLTRALAGLNVENREFYQRIHHQGEKIIRIGGLDDIKKIKNALKAEVEQLREIVTLKQDQERRQIRLLAGKVDSLEGELEKAKSKAMTDGLTCVYNRHALGDYLAEKIESSRSENKDFCVLMIDIDDFKLINDQFGHVIGDRVLVALTQKCRTCIRGDDFLARYGGEEFMIVMDGMHFRNALKKAQQLCSTIASVRYATSEPQTGDYLSLTISIGVTQYKKGDSVDDIIARADKALYDAKRKGKNCVVGRKS
ncbi:MAG: GGDEF domain-containing protein [Desulfobacteraceae bacterium]|nr:MAG: GGDEF domain-containing protein [Desulfobacteraceae bacterium]